MSFRLWMRCLSISFWCVLLPLMSLSLLCPSPNPSAPPFLGERGFAFSPDVSLTPSPPEQVLTHLETRPLRMQDGSSDKDGPPPFCLSSRFFPLVRLKCTPLSFPPLFLPDPADIRGLLPLALAPPADPFLA